MRTDRADHHVAEEALAALLHRLASPLGAIANFAYLLPADGPAGTRDGILAAMASVRDTLLQARRWLDALATAHGEVPAGGSDLAAALREAPGRLGVPVPVDVPDLPRVAVPPATAARLADAILRDAAAAGALSDMRVEHTAGEDVHVAFTYGGRVWSEAEAAHAFDLFSPQGSASNDAQDERAIVGSLADRFGGRAWGAVGPAGEAVLHVMLPATPPTAEERAGT